MLSVARKKCRQLPRRAPEILAALAAALDPEQGITWLDPDPADVLLVANAIGLTTYDASYLCLAGRLRADLLTAEFCRDLQARLVAGEILDAFPYGGEQLLAGR